MAKSVYRNLSLLVGVVLIIVGVLAVWGGSWAHSFVSDQLSSQKITMPSGKSLTTDDMKSHLTKYAGKQLSTGPEARAFADHYILGHMNAAGGGKTYEEVSGEYLAMAAANPKLADGTASADDVKAYNALGDLRNTLFMGNSLRGMLLTAYAWWTVGTIALIAGIVLLVGGVGLGVLAFTAFRGSKTEAAAA